VNSIGYILIIASLLTWIFGGRYVLKLQRKRLNITDSIFDLKLRTFSGAEKKWLLTLAFLSILFANIGNWLLKK